ncbi:MAG: hypothetical protein KZQ62_09335 [Candidatus Thiodiazotropha sp. (ex Lucinoma aequizonata)]|nr:hypothetical protein [Candidatus Thiodiazotropha sp. (ex Lucinoma aequizonata)]
MTDFVLIPDATIEYPNRYNPLVKPPGSLCVEESHPSAKGLSLNLSSRDTMDITNEQSFANPPKEISTERGLAFDFDSTGNKLEYVNNQTLNSDNQSGGYSLFVMFKARPPFTTNNSSTIQTYIFGKSNLLLNWDFRSHLYTGTGKVIESANNGYNFWTSGLLTHTSNSNASPQWYVFGFSSNSQIGSRIFWNGRFRDEVSSSFDPTVSGNLLLGGFKSTSSPWVGQMLACYEWYRAISDEEHASLALSPFQFLRQA